MEDSFTWFCSESSHSSIWRTISSYTTKWHDSWLTVKVWPFYILRIPYSAIFTALSELKTNKIFIPVLEVLHVRHTIEYIHITQYIICYCSETFPKKKKKNFTYKRPINLNDSNLARYWSEKWKIKQPSHFFFSSTHTFNFRRSEFLLVPRKYILEKCSIISSNNHHQRKRKNQIQHTKKKEEWMNNFVKALFIFCENSAAHRKHFLFAALPSIPTRHPLLVPPHLLARTRPNAVAAIKNI